MAEIIQSRCIIDKYPGSRTTPREKISLEKARMLRDLLFPSQYWEKYFLITEGRDEVLIELDVVVMTRAELSRLQLRKQAGESS